mmetsp:Transcript_67140/g.157489  ORF Transcript_67140/g.157489 Transcript_67140/m.157489 type:complete len:207 (-) Transcript_67140:464-1084(-)
MSLTAGMSFTSDIIFTYWEPCPGNSRAAVEDPEEGAEGSGGEGEAWFAVAGVSAMAIFVWFSIAATLRSKKVWMAFLAAIATSGSLSLISISTSSSKQAPRSPICSSAFTAASLVLASLFVVNLQTSEAYICPSSPQPATARTAATRTFQDLSLKSLQIGSKNPSASSPMHDKLSAALALTCGLGSERSSATAAAVEELGLPFWAI